MRKSEAGTTRKPRSQTKDTKGRRELKKADTFKKTPAYRQAVKDTYDEASPKQKVVLREAAKRTDTPEARAIRLRAKQVGTEAKDVKSAADLERGPQHLRELRRKDKKYSPVFDKQKMPDTYAGRGKRFNYSGLPPDLARKRYLKGLEKASSTAQATAIAPALKVLEQTTRPVHAVAAGSKAAITGKNVPKAAVKGFKLKDKTLFSDVIKSTGYKGPGAGIAGFLLDVGLDPLTWTTGGTGTLAKQASKKAGTQTEKKALAKGLTKDQARKFGERAAKKAAVEAGDASGISVRFAGKEVPGIRRGTATLGKGLKRVTDVKGGRKVKSVARKVGSELRPAITPVGLTKGEHTTIRHISRTSRSSTSKSVREIQNRAAALRDKIGPENHTRVIDAIEAGKIGTLPPELKEAAVFFRSQMRHARRLERRAGINVAKRENYVPHVVVEEADTIKTLRPSKKVDPSFAKGRKDNRTLREIREASLTPRTVKPTGPGLVVKETPAVRYSEDAATLYSKRMTEGALARHKAEFNERVAGMGKTINRGDTVALEPHQAIYHVNGPNLKKVDTGDPALQKLVDTGDSGQGGRYVVLNQEAIDRAYDSIVPAASRKSTAAGFDKAQAMWKWIATQPNPGFHLRNFFGDAQNAYGGQSGLKLPGNVRHAAKTLKRVGVKEEAQRTSLSPNHPATTEGVTIGGKKVTYDELAEEAEKVGAIRSGFRRELHDLADDPTKVKRARGGKTRRTLSRGLQNREDLFRMATYIAARKAGKNPEQAVAHMADRHFDYSELTEIERKYLRRAMPFYTFSSRNIPLQFKTLLTRPGKFAQYQKVREEVAKAFGIDLDRAELDMPEYEQRGVPLAIKWKGKDFTLGLGPSGLPIADLNEFPVSANPAKTLDEWLSRGISLVTPAAKSPVELWANMNFFFRDEIERESGPLVPAPAFVKALPEDLQKALHVTDRYYNPRTGKQGLGWSAKADYLTAQFMPGPLGFAKRVMTQSERRQTTPEAKALAYAGIRAAEVKPIEVRVQETYKARQRVEKKLAELRQQAHPANNKPIRADNPTVEYTRLLAKQKKLNRDLEILRRKRGDVIPPKPRKKLARKAPVSSGGFLGGAPAAGSSSGGFLNP